MHRIVLLFTHGCAIYCLITRNLVSLRWMYSWSPGEGEIVFELTSGDMKAVCATSCFLANAWDQVCPLMMLFMCLGRGEGGSLHLLIEEARVTSHSTIWSSAVPGHANFPRRVLLEREIGIIIYNCRWASIQFDTCIFQNLMRCIMDSDGHVIFVSVTNCWKWLPGPKVTVLRGKKLGYIAAGKTLVYICVLFWESWQTVQDGLRCGVLVLRNSCRGDKFIQYTTSNGRWSLHDWMLLHLRNYLHAEN